MTTNLGQDPNLSIRLHIRFYMCRISDCSTKKRDKRWFVGTKLLDDNSQIIIMSAMNRAQHYQRYHRWYEISTIIVFFAINISVLATSVVMEGLRNGNTPSFEIWEPWVWEISSAVSWAILLFPMVRFFERFQWQWHHLGKSFLIYFAASIIVSFSHVGLMVTIRKLIYWAIDQQYNFGDLGFELLYEYRKDLWSFVFVIAVFHSYQFIRSRLLGEASMLDKNEDENTNDSERLLVKKLGKEFVIKVKDVDWLESSGNYVNLHLNGRIYPIRTTLSSLVSQIEDKGFCRVHRSHAVNLDAIESITSMNSGDSEVQLKCGKQLNLSRRYKDSFKQRLK